MTPAPDAAALNGLRDIVSAPAPSWWPPAPGWWLLALTLLALVLSVTPGLRRRWRRRQRRRAALKGLVALHEDWCRHGDGKRFAAELSVLLKRVALTANGRRAAAGRRPLAELELTAGDADLIDLPYRRDAAGLKPEQLERLYAAARERLRRAS